MSLRFALTAVLLIAPACDVSSTGTTPISVDVGQDTNEAQRGRTPAGAADASARADAKQAAPAPDAGAADTTLIAVTVDAGWGPTMADAAVQGPVVMMPASPTPPAPVDAGTSAPSDTAVAPPPALPPPAGAIVRAKDIKVGTLRAVIVVAKTVRCQVCEVRQVRQMRGDKQWEAGRGDGDITTTELIADTLFAKDIRADRLVADEVVAEEFVSDAK